MDNNPARNKKLAATLAKERKEAARDTAKKLSEISQGLLSLVAPGGSPREQWIPIQMPSSPSLYTHTSTGFSNYSQHYNVRQTQPDIKSMAAYNDRSTALEVNVSAYAQINGKLYHHSEMVDRYMWDSLGPDFHAHTVKGLQMKLAQIIAEDVTEVFVDGNPWPKPDKKA